MMTRQRLTTESGAGEREAAKMTEDTIQVRTGPWRSAQLGCTCTEGEEANGLVCGEDDCGAADLCAGRDGDRSRREWWHFHASGEP
jgi:hypothetical protein